MSEKHYNQIAEVLSRAFPSKMMRNQNFLDLVNVLCVSLRADNSNFNEEKFRNKINGYFKNYK